jgi:hypothetical protein
MHVFVTTFVVSHPILPSLPIRSKFLFVSLRSVTVMADATLPVAGKDGDDKGAKSKDMDFLLGLDMLKRFNCMIDLGDGKLKFRLGGQVLETPFLHEHQLDESKGGTKGFDANKANEELMEAQRKYEESRKSGDSMEE